VQINVSVGRDVEHPLGNDATVGDDEDGVRGDALELGAEFEIIFDLLGLGDGDA
jgi:hypothetical protein